MKSRFLGLAIAIAVLAALSGVLYWSNRHPKPSPATLAATGPVVLNVTPSSVTAFSLAVKGTPPVSLVRQSSGQWQITSPEKTSADSDQVSYLLQSLAPLSAQQVVASSAPDLKAYGLDDPTLALDITQKAGASERLLIGDDTPVGNAAYATIAGQQRVFTIAMDAKRELNKSFTGLRDKHLLTQSAGQMRRIDLMYGGQTVVLAHDANRWTMQKPAPYRIDQMAAQSLADALSDAEMDSTQPSARVAEAAWAHGTAIATVTVTGSAGTQTLEVRKNKGDDYAKSNVVEGVFRVAAPLGDSLSKKPGDFRNKQLFDFADNEPDAIDLHIANPKGGSTDVALAHNAQGWWKNGKKVNPDKAEALVSGLRGLTATSFASSGFTTPVITATVTSGGDKLFEKIEIAKSGSKYLGRRAGDFSLYVLDAGAVEGVESAANQIHTAAAK